MLVLTRRISESIRIGDDIVVHVRRIDHGNVRLAIEAPADTRIVRTELLDRGPQNGNDEIK